MNNPVALFDLWGAIAGEPYDTKEQAVQDAASQVLIATQKSVEAGVDEYTPDYSEASFGRLVRGRKPALVSQGPNHVSAFDMARMRIRTLFGKEHWTFVCCDRSTDKWSYDPIRPGRMPDWKDVIGDNPDAPGREVNGESDVGGADVWKDKAKEGCVFVHSHNVRAEEKRFGLEPVAETPTGGSNQWDDQIVGKHGIKVLSVSDDNFADYVDWDNVPVGIPRAIVVDPQP